jgi:hypothetical protein
MDPMDGELLDRLAEKSKRNSRKGRKAKRRLEHLLKMRVRMAENAIHYVDPRAASKKLNREWFKKFAPSPLTHGEELWVYAPNDARETYTFYQRYIHSVKPPRAL